MQECHNLSNVVCPFCGYKMPVEYSNDARIVTGKQIGRAHV